MVVRKSWLHDKKRRKRKEKREEKRKKKQNKKNLIYFRGPVKVKSLFVHILVSMFIDNECKIMVFWKDVGKILVSKSYKKLKRFKQGPKNNYVKFAKTYTLKLVDYKLGLNRVYITKPWCIVLVGQECLI